MGKNSYESGSDKGVQTSYEVFADELGRVSWLVSKWFLFIVSGLLLLSILFSMLGAEIPPKMKHRKIKVPASYRR